MTCSRAEGSFRRRGDQGDRARSRGRPSSLTAAPAIAWSGATTNSRRSSGLTRRPRAAARGTGASEIRSSRPATRSSVVPCKIAETTTTKKTALKIVSLVATSDERTNVASTIGAAPRSPAQPSRSVRDREGVERRRHPDGRADDEHSATRVRGRQRDVRELAREHEQAEHDEQRDLREERDALVEADELPPVARRRAADREADEVHGEEAAAPDRVRSSEGNAAAASDATGANAPIERGIRAKTRSRQPRARPDHESEPDLADDEHASSQAVRVGVLDPGDQPESERDRHRVVAARLASSVRATATDVREAQRREHRSRIGRRDDCPEQKRLEPREVEEPRAATPVRSAVTRTPTVLSSAAGAATSRSLRHEVCSPPSKRIRTRPTMPTGARARRRRTRSRRDRPSRAASPAPGRRPGTGTPVRAAPSASKTLAPSTAPTTRRATPSSTPTSLRLAPRLGRFPEVCAAVSARPEDGLP